MEIAIKLWGQIAYYLPEGRGKFSVKKPVEAGTTVQELVASLGLPEKLFFLINVNGRVIETEYILKEGDEVALFQPFSGG
jgi:sulfur carrier protein ThiS